MFSEGAKFQVRDSLLTDPNAVPKSGGRRNIVSIHFRDSTMTEQQEVVNLSAEYKVMNNLINFIQNRPKIKLNRLSRRSCSWSHSLQFPEGSLVPLSQSYLTSFSL